jgi:Holliday junction resolvase RusA-like endonuclease
MLDALNGIVFRDDSLIITATIMKVFAEKPSLRINVMPLNMAA